MRDVVRRHDGGMDRAQRPRPAQGRLSALGARLEQDFGADVERAVDGWLSVHVVPRAGACPFYWVASDDELLFGMGDGGCRWELSHDTADIDFVEAAVEAAVAGRVHEVFGPGRSQLTVRLGDGVTDRTSCATAPVGCLPVPFWTRSARRRREYLPYGR